ncbi:protein LURP-one-related 15-like [Humulus lupulus]|uniref:protein LURP-one-related 15-like n=1 Tax=Humulus lupulus TaxID=3486 RepID=UPI002B411030|nr:protein LURP-one-related 15-like [Humulus lupulus]
MAYAYAGAAPSGPPMANPIAVVSPHFCAPYPVDLIIAKKLMTLSEGSFAVTDVNGAVMFKVKGSVFSIHDRRLLLDASGNPVISLRQKIITAHRRWQVYRGDSSDSKDLLFSVKKSSLIQFKTELDVFFAANIKEDVPDFKVKGSWLERSCTIYLGNTSNIIAQMHKKHSVESVLLGKDTFSVTVYPHVDYAFIVGLVVILYEINEDRKDDD